MAALEKFSPKGFRTLASSAVEEVFETKVFYLHRGRNAWHSTWTEHFSEHCMHDSLQSAKERSELLREKGSVFTIRELPSLAFRSSVGLLLVTEINTTTPLSSWIRRCREERSSYHLNQNVCGLEQISTRHTMLTDFARALDNSDMFPDLIPARSKNLFVLAGANPDALHENRRRRLKEWHSYSDGAQFYLGWLEDYADMSGRAVRRVADAISSGLNSSRLN